MKIKSEFIFGGIIVTIIVLAFMSGNNLGYHRGAVEGTKNALSWVICAEIQGGSATCDSIFIKMMTEVGMSEKAADSMLQSRKSRSYKTSVMPNGTF